MKELYGPEEKLEHDPALKNDLSYHIILASFMHTYILKAIKLALEESRLHQYGSVIFLEAFEPVIQKLFQNREQLSDNQRYNLANYLYTISWLIASRDSLFFNKTIGEDKLLDLEHDTLKFCDENSAERQTYYVELFKDTDHYYYLSNDGRRSAHQYLNKVIQLCDRQKNLSDSMARLKGKSYLIKLGISLDDIKINYFKAWQALRHIAEPTARDIARLGYVSFKLGMLTSYKTSKYHRFATHYYKQLYPNLSEQEKDDYLNSHHIIMSFDAHKKKYTRALNDFNNYLQLTDTLLEKKYLYALYERKGDWYLALYRNNHSYYENVIASYHQGIRHFSNGSIFRYISVNGLVDGSLYQRFKWLNNVYDKLYDFTRNNPITEHPPENKEQDVTLPEEKPEVTLNSAYLYDIARKIFALEYEINPEQLRALTNRVLAHKAHLIIFKKTSLPHARTSLELQWRDILQSFYDICLIICNDAKHSLTNNAEEKGEDGSFRVNFDALDNSSIFYSLSPKGTTVFIDPNTGILNTHKADELLNTIRTDIYCVDMKIKMMRANNHYTLFRRNHLTLNVEQTRHLTSFSCKI